MSPDKFLSILNKDQVISGAELADRYSHIWKMGEALDVRALLLPETTEQVSAIMSLCHKHQQSVTVHGGLTNLVGGTESRPEDVVLSLERMSRIEEVDVTSRSMTVQAGVILQDVQEAASAKSLLFPLNFGAKGSAQMGGVISSNAGGLRVFRYGMTRQLVLGLEVVLADGTVISNLKKIIKDNSGYDLKQLFIGSEGTLGIVTRAVLKLVEQPSSRCSAFAGINDYNNVIALLKHLDAGSAGKLSGYELIWERTYRAMTAPATGTRPPVNYGYSYYVLIELLGNSQQEDEQLLQDLMADAFEKKLIEDAALTASVADLEWFWRIREDVHAFVSLCTFDQHFDVSLPPGEIGGYVDAVIAQLGVVEGVDHIFPFGHVADGNVHFVIGKANASDALRKQINSVIYNPLRALKGSVSAEHGIGLHKKDYLDISRSPAEIALMKKIKHALDPSNILNRGRIIDMGHKDQTD